MLKAYRELEHDGLVELRQELLAWLGRARAAGLDTEDVVALFETTLRAAAEEGVA